MSNQVFVTNIDSRFSIRKKTAGQVALKVLSSLKYTNTHINLIFISDSKIKRINRQFLNHNWPTDVLAFPFATSLPHGGHPNSKQKIHKMGLRGVHGTLFLGEVFISPKRALVQAPLYQASFKEELARYICHGILHLAGFKDKTAKERQVMRQEEDKILNDSKRYIQRIM